MPSFHSELKWTDVLRATPILRSAPQALCSLACPGGRTEARPVVLVKMPAPKQCCHRSWGRTGRQYWCTWEN